MCKVLIHDYIFSCDHTFKQVHDMNWCEEGKYYQKECESTEYELKTNLVDCQCMGCLDDWGHENEFSDHDLDLVEHEGYEFYGEDAGSDAEREDEVMETIEEESEEA